MGFTDSFDFMNEAELLAWFDFFQEDLEEHFVDVLDWVDGDARGEGQNLDQRDRFEVVGGLRAERIEVD